MPLDGHLDVTASDDSVQFTFTVTNAETEQVEMAFPSGKIADIAVSKSGEEVWRWSAGRMFTQAIETVLLAPGESFTREMAWESPQPGDYTAAASLEASNHSLVERASFNV